MNIDNIAQELVVNEYILKEFSNHLSDDVSSDHVLKKEVEYIYAGNSTDYENVKVVAEHLIAIRFVVDFIYILTDSEKVNEANELATLLVGASELPPLIELTKYLLLAAWSYMEALSDVRDLFDGKVVSLIKNSNYWKTQLYDLFNIEQALENTIENSSGMNYEEYLRILLATKSTTTGKNVRMLDVIQLNLQVKNPNFKLENCWYGFETTQKISINSLWGNMLFDGSNLTGLYEFSYTQKINY